MTEAKGARTGARASAVLGPGVEIDVDRLIATRMLIQANSGGGKSWAIRRLLEQTFHVCQHVVIDVEGEFHSLRERFDYVLAAPSGGDRRIDVASAPLLARRLLQLNVSAIVDIYELGPARHAFMTGFLTALVDAPRELWHPMILVLDEAQKFCSEGGRTESGAAVEALMTLARKRGFCPVLATQRISELRKSAAAECNNKLIGRCGLDVDMARAGRELGFTRREDVARLRSLAPGEFFAFGPAFSTPGVSLVQIGPVKTTHPEAGRGASPPTPPSAHVRAMLAELGDLPADAAEEARTVEGLTIKARRLEGELRELRASRASRGEARVVERIVEKPTVPAGLIAKLDLLARHHRELEGAVSRVARDVGEIHEELRSRGAPDLGRARVKPKKLEPEGTSRAEAATQGETSAAEGRLLEALAFLGEIGLDRPRLEAVALLAGYRPRGGAFHGTRGALRARGLVAYPEPGTMALTERGRALATRDALPPASGVQLREIVLARISEPERRLLTSLIGAYPRALSLAELAAENGYAGSGGAFLGTRSRLRTMGLVDYPSPGFVRAADLLFPDDASATGRRDEQRRST